MLNTKLVIKGDVFLFFLQFFMTQLYVYLIHVCSCHTRLLDKLNHNDEFIFRKYWEEGEV